MQPAIRKPLILAVAALAFGIGLGSQAAASGYTAVQATGTEYHIALSRKTAKPGKLSVEFVNFGQDDHDLAITRKGGGTVKIGVVHPGGRATLNINVKHGSYVFWCTIADHKARGMRAVLRVKR